MLEKIVNMSEQEKIFLLKDLIENDLDYFEKMMVLLGMDGSGDDLLELIIDNKVKEIELFKKLYNVQVVKNITPEDIKSLVNDRDILGVLQKFMQKDIQNADYRKACKEILVILSHVSEEYVKMISPKFLEKLEKEADREYNFIIHSKEDLKNNLREETKDLLNLIMKKFWLYEDDLFTIEDIFIDEEGGENV